MQVSSSLATWLAGGAKDDSAIDFMEPVIMPTIECVTEPVHVVNCAPGCCTPQDIWDPSFDTSRQDSVEGTDFSFRDE